MRKASVVFAFAIAFATSAAEAESPRIDAGERADGFATAPAGGDGVYLLGSEADREAWARGDTTRASTQCFLRPDERAGASRLLIGRRDGVTLVRSERFVDDETLEVATALIDPTSGGARLVERTRTHLSILTRAPLEVATAKEGARAIRFFVRGRKSLEARMPDDSRIASSCGHLAVPLDAAKAGGQMATVTGHVATRDAARTVFVHLSITSLEGEPQPTVSVAFGWGPLDEE